MSEQVENMNPSLIAALRGMWEQRDPVPDGLVDRIIVAVAMSDLDHDWQLLSIMEDSVSGAVRGPGMLADCRNGEVTTLQLGDAGTTVLLHFSDTEDGQRRVDGWVDAPVLAVSLVIGNRQYPGSLIGTGRFAIDSAPGGNAGLRLVVRDGNGMRKLFTPDLDL